MNQGLSSLMLDSAYRLHNRSRVAFASGSVHASMPAMNACRVTRSGCPCDEHHVLAQPVDGLEVTSGRRRMRRASDSSECRSRSSKAHACQARSTCASYFDCRRPSRRDGRSGRWLLCVPSRPGRRHGRSPAPCRRGRGRPHLLVLGEQCLRHQLQQDGVVDPRTSRRCRRRAQSPPARSRPGQPRHRRPPREDWMASLANRVVIAFSPAALVSSSRWSRSVYSPPPWIGRAPW